MNTVMKIEHFVSSFSFVLSVLPHSLIDSDYRVKIRYQQVRVNQIGECLSSIRLFYLSESLLDHFRKEEYQSSHSGVSAPKVDL